MTFTEFRDRDKRFEDENFYIVESNTLHFEDDATELADDFSQRIDDIVLKARARTDYCIAAIYYYETRCVIRFYSDEFEDVTVNAEDDFAAALEDALYENA